MAQAESELPDSEASDDQPELRTADLAKESQNPIASLISVPFQNNTTFGAGPSGEGTPNLLNIQPVIPVPLSEELLLVTRTIVPVVNQPASATRQGSAFGLGDINPQFFFSPVSESKVTWGVGPTFDLPTATEDVLGQGKWSAGPAAVVVVSTGPMVCGAIANNVWSFAGDRDRESVNQLLVQPFLNYNLPKGWYLVSAPIITSNWEAPAGEEPWTVPIGGGFGRVFAIGDQKVNASLQAYWNVVKPDAAGDWSLRAQVQLLFPR
ncbi:neuromedin U [Cyanobium sp. LEGE 06143]|uniref:neuromedin U n=1 Tax=Cyanobium sp. LEGE 06143 TaxID=945727 RepID=UPI001D147F0F|nr:neuromedin U [Cyanobium sp. LEGE 06143]